MKQSTANSVTIYRDIAIVDPHFMYLFGLQGLLSPSIPITDAQLTVLARHRVDTLWGLLADHEKRLSLECKAYCIAHLIIPGYLGSGKWSLTIVSLPMHNGSVPIATHNPSIIIATPSTPVGSTANTSMLSRGMTEVVTAMFTRFRPSQVPIVPAVHEITISDVHSHESPATSTFKLVHWAMQFMSLLRQTPLGKVLNHEILHSLVINSQKEDVHTVRKKFIHFLIRDGEIHYHNRMKYIHFMSQLRFK